MCHAYYFGLNPGWKKMQFQLALNKNFCPTPQPLTHSRLKHHQITKINKAIPSASPLSAFPHIVHNIRTEKQISISI